MIAVAVDIAPEDSAQVLVEVTVDRMMDKDIAVLAGLVQVTVADTPLEAVVMVATAPGDTVTEVSKHGKLP